MGTYTDNLFKQKRQQRRLKEAQSKMERLIGVAIIRDGIMYDMRRGSHSQIRAKLGDEDIYTSNPADTEGFVTDKQRFVTRGQAQQLGIANGQCRTSSRMLLSSDIDW
jgi:hypothetical protein